MNRHTNRFFIWQRAISKLIGRLTIVFVSLCSVVACSTGDVTQVSEYDEVTLTISIPTISIAINTYPTVTLATITPNIQTPMQQLFPTEPAPVSVTTEPDPSIYPTAQVQQNCSESSPVIDNTSDLIAGLVVEENLNNQKGIAILGNNGLDNPAYFLPTANSISSMVSPNKKWLAYYSYDWNGESASAQITVTNILADEEYATHLENLKLQPFDAQFRWANNTQIVLALENEDELFHWLVWYPFEDRQEMISLELTGIGKDIERYDISPVYDPLLELVIYPCEQCGNTEYQVKNVETGETLWTVDIGPDPSSFAYRGLPIWSPNGEFVAIVGGRNLILNGLWIFNRQGALVYEIVLPDIGGVVAAAKLVWSPNSKYLAFSRGTPQPDGWYDLTLAYLAIEDGSITDLCEDISTGFPHWSPDSKKIVFSRQIESGELPRLISVVDMTTGDVVQVFDENAVLISGWMQLAQVDP